MQAARMPSRLILILALLAGASAAVSASMAMAPLGAFIVGFLIVGGLARLFVEPADPRHPLQPPPGAATPISMPSGFGRTLVERLPTPLLVIAPTGRITYANSAARESLPRIEDGTHFAHLIRAPAFVSAVGATLNDGEPRSVQFSSHQRSERFYDARVISLPDGAAFGPEPQAIVQIEDRTQSRRAEQSRSDFIANASHELRTPLASIVGYIETLQHHARDDAAAREKFLAIMEREAGRMQRLVDDLMSLSRIEMSEHVRPAELWSLSEIASESAAALQPVAAREQVDLVINIESGKSLVVCDRDQISQVFTNLIDNAIKYGGPRSTVRVFPAKASAANPGRIGISVQDNGPGIPPDHVHRLTERFYRVNAGQSRSKGGTGLGLAIVKHILNRHAGRLEIASAPGRGSTFTVWIPRASFEE